MPTIPDKLTLAKGASKLVAGSSVKMIVTKLLKEYVPTNNRGEEIQLWIGSLILSGVITGHTSDWVEEKFGDMTDFIEAVQKEVENKRAEKAKEEGEANDE